MLVHEGRGRYLVGDEVFDAGSGDVVVLNVVGKFLPIPGGHPGPASFLVKIPQFGGAGVGQWTLLVPDGSGGWFTVCYEILTSGQIVIRYA